MLFALLRPDPYLIARQLDSVSIGAGALDGALARAKAVLEKGSAEASEMNSAMEELTKVSHRLAEAMYQRTAGTPGSAPDSAGSAKSGSEGGKKKPEEEVIDAEYVDVDENK